MSSLTLAAAFVLLSSSSASAAGYATVDDVSTPGPRGDWAPTDETGRARVVRADQQLNVTRGMELEQGDRIVTEDARVEIRFGDGEAMFVGDHANVEVAERSVLQQLGDVYYQVRGAFSVRYGEVETVVDGTGFVVSGGEPLRVAVTHGSVRVVVPGQPEVHLRGGQSATFPAGQPATPTRYAPWGNAAALGKTFARGAPKLKIGFVAGGGVANRGAVAHSTGFARLLVAPGVRLTLDAGFGSDGSQPGARLPGGLGVELAIGSVSVGGKVVTALELGRLSCDGAYAALHLGGSGSVGLSVPLTRRVSAEAVVNAGGADGLVLDAALGIGLSL